MYRVLSILALALVVLSFTQVARADHRDWWWDNDKSWIWQYVVDDSQDLRVCNAAFIADATVWQAFQDWEPVLNDTDFSWVGACGADGTWDIKVQMADVGGGLIATACPLLANDCVGSSDFNIQRGTITLDNVDYGWTANGARAVIGHELGHLVYSLHEKYYDPANGDTTSDATCDGSNGTQIMDALDVDGSNAVLYGCDTPASGTPLIVSPQASTDKTLALEPYRTGTPLWIFITPSGSSQNGSNTNVQLVSRPPQE